MSYGNVGVRLTITPSIGNRHTLHQLLAHLNSIDYSITRPGLAGDPCGGAFGTDSTDSADSHSATDSADSHSATDSADSHSATDSADSHSATDSADSHSATDSAVSHSATDSAVSHSATDSADSHSATDSAVSPPIRSRENRGKNWAVIALELGENCIGTCDWIRGSQRHKRGRH
jgi:hypothetical protein